MKTTTRLVAATMITVSFGIALASGRAVFFADEGHSATGSAPQVYQNLRARISTNWLSPVSARRSLEQRNQALERWVSARGGWLQVVDTNSELRTRGELGERLRTPFARFEQTLLIHLPAEHAPATIAKALEGIDVTVASISASRSPQRGAARIEF
jgi:hypothetical protein